MAVAEQVNFDNETPVSVPYEEATIPDVVIPEEEVRPPAPKTTALEAEVKHLDAPKEKDVPEGTVTVTLCGTKIRILPQDEWFASANEHFQYMRMNKWAEDALVPEDVAVWLGMNNGRGPRIRELNEMFVEYGAITGMGHPGKS